MKVLRFFGNLCFFGAPILLLFVGILVFSLNPVFGPVDPASVDRPTLIRIMQLRDFRTFSPDAMAAWTDRADAEFGRRGAQRPIFDFSDAEKKIYAFFRENPSNRKSFFETNLMLMARTRYFQWMSAYPALSPDEQGALMREVVDDMKYWETVYMDFLRAADLPIPSIAELIREFEEMIEGFKVGATPEEIVRIDTFKRQINAAIVVREAQGAVDRLSSSVSNMFQSLFPPRKTEKKRRKEPAQ